MNGKSVTIVFILTLLISGCGKQQEQKQQGQISQESGSANIDFEQVFYDFGDLKQGEQVSFVFEFTNTGGSPLLIKDAAASCGCTVPNYDKEPIAPGDKGDIEVVFDSSGRRGSQYKTVIVKTNTPRKDIRLTIKANVII